MFLHQKTVHVCTKRPDNFSKTKNVDENVLSRLSNTNNVLHFSTKTGFVKYIFPTHHPKHDFSGHVLRFFFVVWGFFFLFSVCLSPTSKGPPKCNFFRNTDFDIPTILGKHYCGTPAHYLWFEHTKNILQLGGKPKYWTRYWSNTWTRYSLKTPRSCMLTLQRIYIYTHWQHCQLSHIHVLGRVCVCPSCGSLLSGGVLCLWQIARCIQAKHANCMCLGKQCCNPIAAVHLTIPLNKCLLVWGHVRRDLMKCCRTAAPGTESGSNKLRRRDTGHKHAGERDAPPSQQIFVNCPNLPIGWN